MSSQSIVTADPVAVSRAVDAIFDDLRDRRFLKWLFSARPTLIGTINGDEIRSLDEDVQAEIRQAWAAIISETLCTPSVVEEAVKADAWQDIATAPKDRSQIIVAVPTKDHDSYIVGEAYFDPETGEYGDWWWAGTSYGDYHGGPMSEINHHLPSHWQPLPAPPGRSATP